MQENNRKIVYINMLRDSLLQKDKVLDELIDHTEHQAILLNEPQMDYDLFLKKMSKKQVIIDRLEELDKGFEMIYAKVQEEIKENRYQHQEQIEIIQSLIKSITEKGVKLRALELQNRVLVEQYLASEKNKIRNFKMNNQVASNYYKSMAKLNASESYFMDSKR